MKTYRHLVNRGGSFFRAMDAFRGVPEPDVAALLRQNVPPVMELLHSAAFNRGTTFSRSGTLA